MEREPYDLIMTTPDAPVTTRLTSAERTKAFIDAVVAIAMTLLILPLMESVAESGEPDMTTAEWFVEHQWQLLSFLLSFGIIAMLWINHHRLFSRVEYVTSALLWISMAWLLTIVWLPVATALSSRMSDGDRLVKVVYIGSMIATGIVMIFQRMYLKRHPKIHTVPADALRGGLIADITMCVLFLIAMLIAITVPAIGYYALLLMVLMGPAQRVIGAVMRKRSAEEAAQ